MKESVQTKSQYGDGSDNIVAAYNIVLNAAEYTTSGNFEEAFQIACRVFDEVRRADNLQPDHVTYGSFMGVVAKLMPKSDTKATMVDVVFKRCCADGQLAPVVMKKLKEAATADQYKELLGGVSTDTLPARWTRNIKGAVHQPKRPPAPTSTEYYY